ncbi:DUF5007 domain-containing protein [Sphingobacterium sp. PCS056]|uniref:DUF5007 domain-containing protein n=1 Tax=Sphingobacterium sp. PCS056 TaxID=2931400 RepID=UPI00200BDB3E|nr:DUF5007 domain-containing protein [Sphingobacterium sp. PCS056]UPZ38579.1 DUF5007 domain-containing protein [Sphingobacterium sp. PCS056]
MKKRSFILGIASLSIFVFQACKSDQIGYLSENMRYNVANLQVNQGMVVYTQSLIANGSTTPLTVNLLNVRNKETGELTTEFFKEHEISTYLSEITWRDTTLDQLNAKIGKAKYAAMTLNTIGGRVGFSPATQFVKPGQYSIDVEVSNIAGSRTFKNILDFNVIGAKKDSVFFKSCTSSDYGAEANFLPYTDYEITIEHQPEGGNKIVYIWEDKNGKPFNPKKGEVIKRGDRPTFKNWSPYYPEQVSDTALVYRYPDVSGLVYPIMNGTYVGSEYWSGDPISYYRVIGTATSLGRNLNPVSTIKFYRSGTYIVRFRFLTVTHS